MELLKAKVASLKGTLRGIQDYQISAKGNAVISLHKRNAAATPKAKVECVEDGVTVDVTDLLLVGAALCAFGTVCSLISDLLD